MKSAIIGVGAFVTLASAGYYIPIALEPKTGDVLSTPARYNLVMNKYGLSGPRHEASVLATTGSINLTDNYFDVDYVGKMGIGTPPQIFNMDFDTGSADIWVGASNCTTCRPSQTFKQSQSSTFHLIGDPWRLDYVDGSGVQGYTATDALTLGGLYSTNQTIGLATNETGLFMDLDGIFGLAFPSLSHTGAPTAPVVQMFKEGIIDQPVVGIWLGSAREGGGGELTFGGINPAHYTGQLQYLTVPVKTYWQLKMTAITINNKTLQYQGANTIVDTGTTLIILPMNLTKSIYDQIPGSYYNANHGWRIPCNLSSSTEHIAFTLDGIQFPITVGDIVREQVGLGYCNAGIAGTTTSFTILGDTFLKRYYAVFDYGVNTTAKIGLAPSKR